MARTTRACRCTKRSRWSPHCAIAAARSPTSGTRTRATAWRRPRTVRTPGPRSSSSSARISCVEGRGPPHRGPARGIGPYPRSAAAGDRRHRPPASDARRHDAQPARRGDRPGLCRGGHVCAALQFPRRRCEPRRVDGRHRRDGGPRRRGRLRPGDRSGAAARARWDVHRRCGAGRIRERGRAAGRVSTRGDRVRSGRGSLLRPPPRRGRRARGAASRAGPAVRLTSPMTAETTMPAPSVAPKETRKRILTGDRPTGRLHLGHYVGTLENRVKLQDSFDTFLLVADYHRLTTRLEQLDEIGRNIRDVVLDNLAVGVDPEKVTIYLQSLVPQTAEIHLYFSMLVPVGRDQESHIELTREIARRFNELFAPVFPVPEALIPSDVLLPGTDGGSKMGKSLNNAIDLADDPATVKRKVMGMYTDPARIRATDPGKVEGNPVFAYHDAFNPDKAEIAELKERYRGGRVGDVEVKQRLVAVLDAFLAPIRERRAMFERDPRIVEDIIRAGSDRARAETKATL